MSWKNSLRKQLKNKLSAHYAYVRAHTGSIGWLLGGSIVIFLCAAILFDYCFPLPHTPHYSSLVLARDSTVLHASLTPDQKWRLHTELAEINPRLRAIIVYKEDKYFYYHLGINPLAILRAFVRNIIYWRTTSGASTITMQVARLLEPKNRSYTNKLWEMARALQLEWHYTKDEILQLYLNLIPYGSNIEGVKSASLLFFNRLPQQLSLAQVVALAIIPNRPNSWTLGKHNEALRAARDKWLHRLQQAGIFAPAQIHTALQEPLRATRLAAPQGIPQLAYRLHQQSPTQANFHTTLDASIQAQTQQLTTNYLQRWKAYGIHNAAVLVIDNQHNTVLAYIASGDFGDKAHQGEVDGIVAIRSPGSTLKPLVYALAIDKGIITPKTMVADVPRSFQGFAPENFHKNFAGAISIERALVQSLNIPAVNILEQIGIKYFISTLKSMRFAQISRDEGKLGLSLVLGGCGLTLEELTNAYTALARQGKWQPIQYLQTQKDTQQVRICSPAAAWMIGEILTTAQRPDLPSAFDNSYRLPKVAWKTGTSYGRRDAWSVGYNAHYTVGVWVGNFSGASANHLVGAELATPLLFDIFNSLPISPKSDWWTAPKQVQMRWVCAESGLPPAGFCINQVIDAYIPGISPTKNCRHLEEVVVSLDERESYCPVCQPAAPTQRKHYANLPPEILAYYLGRGSKPNIPPPHARRCTRLQQGNAPVIVSPKPNREYIIDRNNPSEIELQAQAAADVGTVYWYLNDAFYRAATPQEKVFFRPKQGAYRVACSDERGRSAEIRFLVRYE